MFMIQFLCLEILFFIDQSTVEYSIILKNPEIRIF